MSRKAIRRRRVVYVIEFVIAFLVLCLVVQIACWAVGYGLDLMNVK